MTKEEFEVILILHTFVERITSEYGIPISRWKKDNISVFYSKNSHNPTISITINNEAKKHALTFTNAYEFLENFL